MLSNDLIQIIIIFVLVGISVGFISSFFGVGASFIMAPIMMICFEIYLNTLPSISPLISFGTNMSIVIPTAISGTYKHIKELKKENIEFPLKHYTNFAIPVGFGSLTGTILVYSLFLNFRDYTGFILKILYGLFCIISSYKYVKTKIKPKNFLPKIYKKKSYILGYSSGLIAHFIGIGGGLFYLSILNTILEIPIQIATLLSLSTMIIGSSIGFSMFLVFGYHDYMINSSEYPPFTIGWFNYLAFLCIGIPSLIFAQIGPILANKISPKKFKILIVCLYIIIGIWLIFNGLYYIFL
ncbi:MAG: sulfite exporter TauE/SafE family protein [Candidatus Helarchaeota archaeon]